MSSPQVWGHEDGRLRRSTWQIPRMLLAPLMEDLANRVLVRHTPGLQGAVVVPAGKGRAVPCVQTAGVNFQSLAKYEQSVDIHEVRS